ncbi:MAG: hypothetical protein ACOYUZ_03800 [Patescibacteria group bacterium]
MAIILLRAVLRLMGYATQMKYSGFAIQLSWPDPKCLLEISQLRSLLNIILPKDYFYTPPMINIDQKMTVFVWRKDDPLAIAFVRQHRFMMGVL